MKIEEYAIKAMEALIRYGKMPMSDTKRVADTAWEVAKRMKELEQQVNSVDLDDVVGRSEQLTAFNEWLDDNHHSFKIPDMILQDYIRYGG